MIGYLERAGAGVEVDLAVQLLQFFLQSRGGIRPLRQTKENVLAHAEVGKQHRLLRHQINAQLVGQRRAEARKRAVADRQLTAIRGFDAGDDLHQRRFTRAIASHQGMHLARA
ncbi:Uncharacterised protein [Klebsiella pneumoniae]|nr:Uncharacterised protein [Klebsiella pneumoniae]